MSMCTFGRRTGFGAGITGRGAGAGAGLGICGTGMGAGGRYLMTGAGRGCGFGAGAGSVGGAGGAGAGTGGAKLGKTGARTRRSCIGSHSGFIWERNPPTSPSTAIIETVAPTAICPSVSKSMVVSEEIVASVSSLLPSAESSASVPIPMHFPSARW